MERDAIMKTESYVMVKLRNGQSFVLPRDQPRFSHGFEVDCTGDTTLLDFGGNLVVSKYLSYEKTVLVQAC